MYISSSLHPVLHSSSQRGSHLWHLTNVQLPAANLHMLVVPVSAFGFVSIKAQKTSSSSKELKTEVKKKTAGTFLCHITSIYASLYMKPLEWSDSLVCLCEGWRMLYISISHLFFFCNHVIVWKCLYIHVPRFDVFTDGFIVNSSTDTIIADQLFTPQLRKTKCWLEICEVALMW